MRSSTIICDNHCCLVRAPALADDVKVGIGISGWTGFAPLTLAKEAGIFKKNGLDVAIKKIPQKDRHLAIASGDIQCAATTVETWISWNANGVATKQIFQLDKSYGADGMAVRNDIASIKDLKGKTVAASAPGTSPYFVLAWMLKKNGLSVKDVTVVNLEPQPAANAFVAGQNDAAMTYEPYLSTSPRRARQGKIIATTLDYPMVMDTFGCTPKFLSENPKAAQGAGRQLFRGARHDRQGPGQGVRDHGRRREADRRAVRQLGQISALAGQAANQKFFGGDFQAFNKDAADLLLEIGMIKAGAEGRRSLRRELHQVEPRVHRFLPRGRRPRAPPPDLDLTSLDPVAREAAPSLGFSFFVAVRLALERWATYGGVVSRPSPPTP